MSIETLLFIILIILLISALPSWPYSGSWGYRPSGILTILLVLFIFWAVSENRPIFRSSASSSAHSVAQDLKATGQDLGDSVRRAVQ